jgi:hypothetical protein
MIDINLKITEKKFYIKLFNSLQEGIIVVQNEKITFMNELSSKVLNKLSGLKDF